MDDKNGESGTASRGGGYDGQAPRPKEELEHLAGAAKQGDQQAALDLLEIYRPLLRSAVRRNAKAIKNSGAMDEEDLWQEARLALLELLREYRPGGCSSLGTYLWTKLPKRVSNRVRPERRQAGSIRPLQSEDEELEGLGGVEGPVLDGAGVTTLMSLLSERQREALRRTYWGEESAEQLAITMRISPQAARRLKKRATRQLREIIQMF